MRNILNLIRKKGRNIFILNVILLVLLGLYAYSLFTEDRTYGDLFKGICEVNNIDDLENCYANNYYIRVYLDEVYSTNYGYYVDDVLKAYYVDIDVDGYSFITLVNDDVAEELFNDNNSITYIDGVITNFNKIKEHNRVIDKIKSDYLKDFGKEFTMEDIDNMVLPIQMNAYQNSKSANIAILIIIAGIGILNIIYIIKGLLIIIKPDKYKSFIKIENQDKLQEEFENKVIFENSNICLLPNYIIKKNVFNIKIKKNEDLVWIYQRISKQYGITVSKRYILNFKDGDNFDISIKEENILNEFKQSILVGYTNENIKEYRKIVVANKRKM